MPTNNPWSLYDELIGGIPNGPQVTDFCIGTNWTYVHAECGMGIAFTTTGGARKKNPTSLVGQSLREVAELARSWRFEDASLGIAALNAWYSNRARLAESGLSARFDEDEAATGGRGGSASIFDLAEPEVRAAGPETRVVVVGHFPRIERFSEFSQLTILERNCRDEWDTPDPACEYVLPGADWAFITGVTLINKTVPRLLQLAGSARTYMVGPSVVLAPALIEAGADVLSGSVVADEEACEFAVKRGGGKLFGAALETCEVTRG